MNIKLKITIDKQYEIVAREVSKTIDPDVSGEFSFIFEDDHTLSASFYCNLDYYILISILHSSPEALFETIKYNAKQGSWNSVCTLEDVEFFCANSTIFLIEGELNT